MTETVPLCIEAESLVYGSTRFWSWSVLAARMSSSWRVRASISCGVKPSGSLMSNVHSSSNERLVTNTETEPSAPRTATAFVEATSP
ncbi:hypothetical protein PG22511B_0053 [Bifidobacterium pseudolongum subsp. globosum]|nr:hypothetical protein PG22511B_0053 [Bifidobacterium pseudolongum subsp. globosum]